MSNILSSLMQHFGDDVLQNISGQVGADKNQVQSALTTAMPLLLSAVQKKANSQGGVSGLMSMLDQDGDGDFDVQDVMSLLGSNRGQNILSSLLGNKKSTIEGFIGQNSGLNSGAVSSILSMAAPLVMSQLGKARKEGNDMGNLLGSITGMVQEKSPEQSSIFGKLLDQDGDGNSADDIAQLGAGLLGKMFK